MSPTDNSNMMVINLLLANSCSSKKKKMMGVRILFLGIDLRSTWPFPCVNLMVVHKFYLLGC